MHTYAHFSSCLTVINALQTYEFPSLLRVADHDFLSFLFFAHRTASTSFLDATVALRVKLHSLSVIIAPGTGKKKSDYSHLVGHVKAYGA